MVAAWISALTGGGPAIASGSHVCSGNWGGVHQRAERSGAGHRVRQPRVQRELGRLADAPDEKGDGTPEQERVGDVAVQGVLVQLGDVEALIVGEVQRADTNEEADVTGAGGEERLEGGVAVGLLLPPVAD